MKPKLYKSLFIRSRTVPACFRGSCTDLSETIYNQIASEKYEFTEKDAASMFAPVYSSLRNFYWVRYGYADLDICTDMWVIPLRIGVGWGDLYINLHEHTFHSEIGHFSGLWSNAYSGINACNKLLADEAVQESEESVAQLRAYRACCITIFCSTFSVIFPWIPLMIIPTAGFLNRLNRRKYGILSSLSWTDIKDKCGDYGDGKINNYTVHMILAKMYLNHNAWFDDHSDDSYYRKCVDELNVIIESNKFSLAPNYADNFKKNMPTTRRAAVGGRRQWRLRARAVGPAFRPGGGRRPAGHCRRRGR